MLRHLFAGARQQESSTVRCCSCPFLGRNLAGQQGSLPFRQVWVTRCLTIIPDTGRLGQITELLPPYVRTGVANMNYKLRMEVVVEISAKSSGVRGYGLDSLQFFVDPQLKPANGVALRGWN